MCALIYPDYNQTLEGGEGQPVGSCKFWTLLAVSFVVSVALTMAAIMVAIAIIKKH